MSKTAKRLIALAILIVLLIGSQCGQLQPALVQTGMALLPPASGRAQGCHRQPQLLLAVQGGALGAVMRNAMRLLADGGRL